MDCLSSTESTIDFREQFVHKIHLMEETEWHEIDECTKAFLEDRIPPRGSGDRTAKLRELAGVAGYADANPRQLVNLFNRKRALSTAVAERLARHFGFTHLEMLQEGFEILRGKPRIKPDQIPPALEIQQVQRFETFAGTFSKQSYIPIRILEGAAAAGEPREVNERSIKGWALIFASKEWMPNDPENYTCVHVSGLSMYPILQDGDIVAVDHAIKDPAILDKKMVVFRVNGGTTIKWLKYFPDKALVVGVPENKSDLEQRGPC